MAAPTWRGRKMVCMHEWRVLCIRGERVLLDRREGVHVRGVSKGERGGSVQGSCVCEGSVVSEGDVWWVREVSVTMRKGVCEWGEWVSEAVGVHVRRGTCEASMVVRQACVCEGTVCEGTVCEGTVCEGTVCEGTVCEGVDVRGSTPCHQWCQTWWAGCRLWCAQSLPPSGPPVPGWTWPTGRLPRYPLEPLLRREPGLVYSHGLAMEGRDRAFCGHHQQRCTRRYAHMRVLFRVW